MSPCGKSQDPFQPFSESHLGAGLPGGSPAYDTHPYGYHPFPVPPMAPLGSSPEYRTLWVDNLFSSYHGTGKDKRLVYGVMLQISENGYDAYDDAPTDYQMGGYGRITLYVDQELWQTLAVGMPVTTQFFF